MRDAPLSPGDVLGMAGLVAFAASAVVLWSVSPADAMPLDGPELAQDGASLLGWVMIVFGLACFLAALFWPMRKPAADDELDYRDAESRGGRDV